MLVIETAEANNRAHAWTRHHQYNTWDVIPSLPVLIMCLNYCTCTGCILKVPACYCSYIHIILYSSIFSRGVKFYGLLQYTKIVNDFLVRNLNPQKLKIKPVTSSRKHFNPRILPTVRYSVVRSFTGMRKEHLPTLNYLVTPSVSCVKRYDALKFGLPRKFCT